MSHPTSSPQQKRPAFQFYPGDEERDTALRLVSLEAYGLWHRMLNLMHDGEPYGHLATASGPITPEELARAVSTPRATVKRLLSELETRGVFSRNEAGVIFSRRMVRDEYKRNVRGAGGSKSLEHPNVPRPKRDDAADSFVWQSSERLEHPAIERGMTHEELGLYMTLRSLCHVRGAVALDAPRLPLELGGTAEQFRRVWPAIAPCFVRSADGLTISHPEQ